ncbi:PREDICTED: putative uncharacterized protein DDB_G0282133 isoform X2 [Ceratosolen solmsi marchali]|nr:PREDICTED: putative uncharacterized protein DDB_G0282133 isoform X2 [Ceratosolen solmsi marchali]XP_011501261.1 PREDICTED: putative uncharacterized protein DDB_G0282133 isoform X2 [Ceratosolen solmsi marchali]
MSRRNKPQTQFIIHRDPTKPSCCFCGLSEENEVEYGKFYQHSGIITHYYCLLLSSNMEQKGNDDEGILGFLADDIQKEIRRGKRLVCSYCRRNGATLGCCNTKCKKIFHFPCGLKAGSLHQFFGEFRSYCINHRPKQKIDERVKNEIENMSNILCYICYEDVEPLDCNGTLWAPCCQKNAWFHRKCVQQLAMSAGYFFKCPLCNNKREFQTAMLEYGIYIPRQDASWELVPNAFEELLYRHNRCDSMACLCPKGRTYTSSNAKWELVLCRMCGSQGTHLFCSRLKWANPVWECQECIAIIKPGKSRIMTDDSTSNSDDATRQRRNTTLNLTIREYNDDSDSDISVGNDREPIENNIDNIPMFLPQLKLRPGPRSFKLQQVEKLKISEATKECYNSTHNSPSNSNIAVNSNILNNIGNTRVSATSTNLFGEVICLDSDDEAVEILCENAMKSTIRSNGISHFNKMNKAGSSDTSNILKSHLESGVRSLPNKSNTVYIGAAKISGDVASAIVEESGDSSFNIIISNVTSVPPEFFESAEEPLADDGLKYKTELASSVSQYNLKRNHPLDEENGRPLVIEASKRARLEAAHQQINYVESANVADITKDSIMKIERIESLDDVLSNVKKQSHGKADMMTPLIGSSSATSSLESCHGDAGTSPAMVDTSRFCGQVRTAVDRIPATANAHQKSWTATPVSVNNAGSNSELAFRTVFENGSSSHCSNDGSGNSGNSKSKNSTFNRSGLIPDCIYLDEINFKTYGDNVDIIYGTHTIRLKMNGLRNMNLSNVAGNVVSTSASPFAGSNFLLSSEKSSKSFQLRSDDSDEFDNNSKSLNNEGRRSFVYEDDNTLLEYPTSASVSHNNVKILKKMSLTHDKTVSRFAKNDLKENWDPEISSSSNNTFDSSNNNNNQINYSDLKENNTNSYEKSNKNDDDNIFSQTQRDDLCANQRFSRRSNRFIRHFRSVRQSNVMKNGRVNGDSTDLNLSTSSSLSSSSGKSNKIGEIDQSIRSKSLNVINSSDIVFHDKHFENVGVNDLRLTITDKVNDNTHDNSEIVADVDFKVSIDLQKISNLINAKPDLFFKTKNDGVNSPRAYRVNEKLKIEFELGETKFITKSQSFDCLLDYTNDNLFFNRSKSLEDLSFIDSNDFMIATDKKDCIKRNQRRKTRQFEKHECFSYWYSETMHRSFEFPNLFSVQFSLT